MTDKTVSVPQLENAKKFCAEQGWPWGHYIQNGMGDCKRYLAEILHDFENWSRVSVPTESRPLKELEDFLRTLRATLERQADLPSADNEGIKAIIESGRKRLDLADAALQQIKLASLPVGESTRKFKALWNGQSTTRICQHCLAGATEHLCPCATGIAASNTTPTEQGVQFEASPERPISELGLGESREPLPQTQTEVGTQEKP